MFHKAFRRLTDFGGRIRQRYDIWRGNCLRDSEWFALGVLLAGSDPRLKKFRLQWECGTQFYREKHPENRAIVRWRFSNGCLHHPTLHAEIKSPKIAVLCEETGNVLLFNLRSFSDGWCNCLECVPLDNDVHQLQLVSEAEAPPPPTSFLPPIADQRSAHGRFSSAFPEVELFLSEYGNVELSDSISNEELNICKKELETTLPATYLSFIKATNGILLGETQIVGAYDAVQFAKYFNFGNSPNLFLAYDLINCLADGVWHIPLTNNPHALVWRTSNYAEPDPERLTFSEFLKRQVELARETEAIIASFVKRRFLDDVPHGFQIVEIQPPN
ncbi:hypothetical protein [Schlesneria sp.]|uniref:hypothetical protein n=1 Tax=Schlesneria sp. TaxID=2762018 RepID=UPI002F0108B8